MRSIHGTFIQLASVMSREIETGDVDSKERKSGVLDMSEWMGRVALESVGRAILGYSFDPLDSPHNNQYTSAIKELMWVLMIPMILVLVTHNNDQPDIILFGTS